jgi:formylglycine-generating enzyme required for sulfatase activity
VVLVSWHDAVAYCNWLAEVTGKPYHLPSEAEWEKGGRGSDGRIYPWGNQWDAKRCNSEEGSKGGTTPVGAYPHGASPHGLLDMAGNVWEWTRSLWGEDWQKPSFKYPYDPDDGREDLNAPASVCRVLRGGSWYDLQWQRPLRDPFQERPRLPPRLHRVSRGGFPQLSVVGFWFLDFWFLKRGSGGAAPSRSRMDAT